MELIRAITIQKKFYVVGIYKYEEDATSFSSEAEEDVTTSAYIPITMGKELMHTAAGYERFTIVTSSQLENVTDFATEVKNYMNQKFYATNEEYQISTMTMSTITNSMNDMIQTVSIAIAFIAGISLLVGGIDAWLFGNSTDCSNCWLRSIFNGNWCLLRLLSSQ